MKMRRESLGQILLLRKGILTPSKHKMILRERKDMSPGNSPIVFSPRSKKRPIPISEFEEEDSNTPSKKSIKLDESTSTATPKMKMPPPPVANVQLRAKINKKINRSTSAWKTLSLGRRGSQVKNDAAQIFRSPSIYENEKELASSKEEQNDVMTKYLSGKIVPLTPSQQPTNVSHLVDKNEKAIRDDEDDNDENKIHQEVMETNSRDAEFNHAIVPTPAALNPGNYCSIM